MIKNIFSKSNKRKALIISSISPENMPGKDMKNFFMQTEISHLDYLDSVDFIDNSISFSEAAMKFNSWIKAKYDDYDIFLGFAFGGVLLQHALNKLSSKKVILISSPGSMTGVLRLKISSLVNLLNKEKLHETLCKLHEFVTYKQSKNIHNLLTSHQSERNTIKRLLKGFNMILNMQIVDSKFSTDVINIVGNRSNLVTHLDVNNSIGRVFKIPNSGMRVLEDNPKILKDIINNFILEPNL